MFEDLRVAIVHDDFIQRGGAERLVLAMLEVFPKADVYALMASRDWVREFEEKGYVANFKNSRHSGTSRLWRSPPWRGPLRRWQKSKILETSWLQRLPFKERFFHYYYAFYPLAVESFSFDGYDLVLSSSARYAHGIITKPGTIHVAYVNSPARFLWEEEFIPKGWWLHPLINWQRTWDTVAGQRPDYLLANSKTPAERIRKYWSRKVDKVIYPFVDLERFSAKEPIRLDSERPDAAAEKGYFLVVSRLKYWKKIEVAIEACNQLRRPLLVVGDGEAEAYLRSLAGPTIRFRTQVRDAEIVSLYIHCRALILTQAEDFGITSLEAQASGKPVIAFKAGGALETVVAGRTGVFFEEQTAESLKEVLLKFDPKDYFRENCLARATEFSQERFQKELRGFIGDVLRSR